MLVIPEFRDGRSFAPRSLGDFRIYPGAAESARRLKDAGYSLVVVTNQPDVGNGLVEKTTVEEMHRRLRDAIPLDAIEACYHHQCRQLRLPKTQARHASAGRRADQPRLQPQYHDR